MPDLPRSVVLDDGRTLLIGYGQYRRSTWRRYLDNVDELVERYQAGESLMALAIAWNASPSVVRRELVERGIDIRPAPSTPPRRSVEEVEELARRYRAGATYAALGKEQGVSRERIRQILRKHGVFGRS